MRSEAVFCSQTLALLQGHELDGGVGNRKQLAGDCAAPEALQEWERGERGGSGQGRGGEGKGTPDVDNTHLDALLL